MRGKEDRGGRGGGEKGYKRRNASEQEGKERGEKTNIKG